MLTIQWESLDSLIASGLEDLAVAHWEAAEIDKEDVPLALDFERARAAEKIGQQRFAALRRDHALVGYAAFTVSSALFHRATLCAWCNGIYVDPAHRGFASLWLVRWCEQALKDLGVRKVYIGSRSDTLAQLLDLNGYVRSETMHSKLLGDSHVRRHRTRSVPTTQSGGGRGSVPAGG